MDLHAKDELKNPLKSLEHWANRENEAREKYANARYELGLMISTLNLKGNMSFENKVLTALALDQPEGIKLAWKNWWRDLIMYEQQYKGARAIKEALQEKINAIKFINRLI